MRYNRAIRRQVLELLGLADIFVFRVDMGIEEARVHYYEADANGNLKLGEDREPVEQLLVLPSEKGN